MDRQALRDWVIRFNDQGPDGLFNIPSLGAPPKLDATHRAFLARIVEEGPIPAVHGVARWRACDLIMRLHEEFGLSVSDDTIYCERPSEGLQTRPRGRRSVQKKLCCTRGGYPRRPRLGHLSRGVVSDAMEAG
jgi:transposase